MTTKTDPQTLSTNFELTPPEPVKTLALESASGRVKIKPDDIAKLDEQINTFIQQVVTLEVHDQQFKDRVNAIHNLGNAEIMASASVSNRMLERPIKAMQSGLFDSGSTVSKGLVDLRISVESLDPSGQGDLLSPRKLLGFIPFGNRIRDYFYKYVSAQSHIDAIIESLRRGKDELERDNAAIEQEKTNLWGLMEKLEQYIYVGKRLDSRLDEKVRLLDASDKEKARIVREEMLFYCRQKVTDLLTQLAVNVQGYLALDVIRKNNLELVKGVDRATTTTVSALRTAVIVAQALNNQKLVLDQIKALNTTTGNMIEGTSKMLKQQSVEIHEQAASGTIELEKLKNAFQNIYDTMDSIAQYKTKALDSMQQTIAVLSGEVEKSKKYVDRVRQEDTRDISPKTDNSPDNIISL